MPGRSMRPVTATAPRTADRSGPLSADNGVGTQMTTVSGFPASSSLDVARKPFLSISAISGSGTSPTCERPAFSAATISALRS